MRRIRAGLPLFNSTFSRHSREFVYSVSKSWTGSEVMKLKALLIVAAAWLPLLITDKLNASPATGETPGPATLRPAVLLLPVDPESHTGVPARDLSARRSLVTSSGLLLLSGLTRPIAEHIGCPAPEARSAANTPVRPTAQGWHTSRTMWF
jgi:hypothetical protein